MTSTTAGLLTFTATATAGATFQTQLPTSVSHASVSSSILAGGVNPIEFHSSHAIQLLVVQLVIIIVLSRFLHWGFGKLCPWTSQPRVCFEILAGILLGPTAFGQIPGFSKNIFPSDSLPFMNLLATIGLVLFLFVIGLEVDFTLFKRNLKPSLSVSLAGLVIPFALGWGVSIGLYHQFVDPSVTVTTFSCFIATSSSITAFPVLGRILVDLKLMHDPVGVVVLASGVANDVIGWMLLALSVALATAGSGGGGSGIVVLYILLTTVAWMLFLFFIVRPLLNLVARKTGSFNNPDGPSQTYILAVLMAVFISGWFMAAIGISEIFGGFLVGLIVPSSLGHHIAAKIEDLCICIFIPLYFAYSGLRTNLTLLNSGIIWAWAICVIVCAFCGKFFGCFFAARFTGFTTRESAGVGFLMSSKGLIELIILNQGLSVGIINETVFSIFVLEALLLTLAATPGTLLAYPARVRKPAVTGSSSQGTDSSNSDTIETRFSTELKRSGADSNNPMKRITVVLDKLEGLGALFVFTNLLSSTRAKAPNGDDSTPTTSLISINPLRLIELTERLSGVLLASDAAAEHLRADPLTLLYRTFATVVGGGGGPRGIKVKEGEFAVTQSDNFAETVKERASRDDSDLVVVPWSLVQESQEQDSVVASYLPNPFEHLFGGSNSSSNPSSSTQPDSSLYASFLRDLFASATCDVGIFFDRGISSVTSPSPSNLEPGSTHVFLPFFGGSDDRACINLAVQLVKRSPSINVTVLLVQRAPEETEEDRVSLQDSSSSMLKTASDDTNASTAKTNGPALQLTVAGGTQHSSSGPGELGGVRPGETLYPTQHALASETEDDLLLEQVRLSSSSFLGKLEILSTSTAFPLKTMVRRATSLSTATPSTRLVFLIGRSRRDASSHRVESLSLLKEAEKDGTLGICASQEVRKCVGEAASAALISGIGENVWVVQSSKTGGRRVMKAFKGREA